MITLDVAAVYAIELPTGRTFVGASRAVRRMWNTYLHRLRTGTFRNREIQRAFDLFGEQAVKLSVLESTTDRDQMETAMRVRAWATKMGAHALKCGRPKLVDNEPVAGLPEHVRARLAGALSAAELDRKAEDKRLAEERTSRERTRRLEADDRMNAQKAETRARAREDRNVRRLVKMGFPEWASRNVVRRGKSKPEPEAESDW